MESKSVIEILKELENESSRNGKIAILEREKDNKLLRDVIKLALDEHKIFYMKKVPEYDSSIQGIVPLKKSIQVFSILESRTVTGNKAQEVFSMAMENCIPEDREVMERILQKDLKCGVNIATANKVYGKSFLLKYPCMLASSQNDKNLSNIVFPAYGQIKYDGMRINIIRNKNGSFEYKTRNGRGLEASVWDVIFDDVPNGTVIDGEALVLGEGGKLLDRKTGNGILNKIVKGTATDEEKNCIVFVVWDMVTLQQFRNGSSAAPYDSRFEALNMVFPPDGEVSTRCRVAQTWTVESLDLAKELFQHCLQMGDEGIILKNIKGIWEDKRSKNLVKMKNELEADLVVTDWHEGTGKYEGLMGSVTAKTADGKLEVNIGSGFTDEQRKKHTKDYIVGKIVCTKYNEIIQDKTKETMSLFLPIFVEIREDKNEANNLEELM